MGRLKTGLRRRIPVLVYLSEDEDELLAREAYENASSAEEQLAKSKTELLRRAFFRRIAAGRLDELRQKQKAMPVSMFRREGHR